VAARQLPPVEGQRAVFGRGSGRTGWWAGFDGLGGDVRGAGPAPQPAGANTQTMAMSAPRIQWKLRAPGYEDSRRAAASRISRASWPSSRTSCPAGTALARG
jgi:hypothetical protein